MLANTADVEEVTNYLRAFRLVRDNLRNEAGLPIWLALLGGMAIGFAIVALILKNPLQNGLLAGNETLYWVFFSAVLFYAASYYARGYLAGSGWKEYRQSRTVCGIPLPAGLSLRESMILGTAGFTAALGLLRMEENRQTPVLGPLAVTGATGGVGSLAVDIFTRAGYEVHAISGKPEHAGYLKALGATEVLGREALAEARPLENARFGGGLDNVGGAMLASLLARTRPYGNVASAGLAAAADLPTTVMPFIIRGVSLLGVASAGTARDLRQQVWERLASVWKPAHLDTICTREITLDALPEVFAGMLAGGSRGRTLVRIG